MNRRDVLKYSVYAAALSASSSLVSAQKKDGDYDAASYAFCPNGSHMALWDDQAVYFKQLLAFPHSV